MILVIDNYIIQGNEDEIISFIKRYNYENKKHIVKNNIDNQRFYEKLFGLETKENKYE